MSLIESQTGELIIEPGVHIAGGMTREQIEKSGIRIRAVTQVSSGWEVLQGELYESDDTSFVPSFWLNDGVLKRVSIEVISRTSPQERSLLKNLEFVARSLGQGRPCGHASVCYEYPWGDVEVSQDPRSGNVGANIQWKRWP